MAEQPLVLGEGVVGSDEREHLDLVELVDAQDARVSLPAAPASRRKHGEMPA